MAMSGAPYGFLAVSKWYLKLDLATIMFGCLVWQYLIQSNQPASDSSIMSSSINVVFLNSNALNSGAMVSELYDEYAQVSGIILESAITLFSLAREL